MGVHEGEENKPHQTFKGLWFVLSAWVMGTGILVHSLGSMNLPPMILMLNFRDSVHLKKKGVIGAGTLVRYLSRISGTCPYDSLFSYQLQIKNFFGENARK